MHIRFLFDELQNPDNKDFLLKIPKGSFNILVDNFHDGCGHVNLPVDVGVKRIKELIG
jgi:hypothetical protein